MTQKQAATKVADIRYRTEIKRNHIVVYTVRDSADTKDYHVTVNAQGRVNHCDCPDTTGHCYHRRDCQAREDERKQQEPFASRLHNGVTLDKFNADVERENSEESLARREQESRERLPLHRNNTPLEAAPSGVMVPMR